MQNPKLCINYKHWIHNCNKNMIQFYISTNKTCALNLIWGEEPQPLIKCKQTKWEGLYHSYLFVSLDRKRHYSARRSRVPTSFIKSLLSSASTEKNKHRWPWNPWVEEFFNSYAIPKSEHILRWKAILAWIEGEMTLCKVKHN